MSILFVMIPLAMMLLAAAVWAFFWAVRSGQFDDLEAQGTLVLFDDEPPTRNPGTATGFAPGSGGATPERIHGSKPGTDRAFAASHNAAAAKGTAGLDSAHPAGTR